MFNIYLHKRVCPMAVFYFYFRVISFIFTEPWPLGHECAVNYSCSDPFARCMIVGGLYLCVCWPKYEEVCENETLTIDGILCPRNFSQIPDEIEEKIEEDDGPTCCVGLLCPEVYIPMFIVVFLVAFAIGLKTAKKSAVVPRTDIPVRYSPEVTKLF